MKSPFVAGLVLVATLTILALYGWGSHQRSLRDAAEAKVVQAELEAAGLREAAAAPAKEIIKFVEVPQVVERLVKEGKVTPIAAGKVEATSQVIHIPCPPPTTEVPVPEFNVQFGLTGDFLIVGVKGGKADFTGGFKATLFDRERNWSQPLEFDPANVKFDIAVNEELTKALDAYHRSWWRKHFRPYVGVGVHVNPFSGRPDAGVQVGWGYVF